MLQQRAIDVITFRQFAFFALVMPYQRGGFGTTISEMNTHRARAEIENLDRS